MHDDVRMPVSTGSCEGQDYRGPDQGELNRALPGSATEKVARSAEVPVLTVPA